ncbi:Hypothetical protein ABZS17I87_04053 [Kosakonia cowanii]
MLVFYWNTGRKSKKINTGYDDFYFLMLAKMLFLFSPQWQ